VASKSVKISQTTKYLIIMCSFLLAVIVSLGYVLIRQSSQAIRKQIEERMLDVSNTAAAMLDGDTLEKLQAEDVNTPEYKAAHAILTCFEENIELEYIYCVRDMGNKNFVFMIDPDPELPGAFGDHIPYTDALYQASTGVSAVDEEPYQDNWGTFYSAYSPVFDSNGQVAGIVAVDFSAEWYDRQISNQIRTTLAVCGIAIFAAAVIIIVITTRFRKRIRTMFQEMNNVSDGIETLIHETMPGVETDLWKNEAASSSDDDITELGDKIHYLQDRLSEQISFVRSQAYYDGLTGLGNRTAYEEQVRQIAEEIDSRTAAFGIALFDLNGLKEINDRQGHEKGDQVIRSAAGILRDLFKDGKVFRIGGDEFIVYMEGSCTDLAQRAEAVPVEGEVSMARGFAVYNPAEDLNYSAVFHRADNAMYQDKQNYYLTHERRVKH
jgi:diguanylate cyclase (GGDEF)-like protein